MLKKDFNLTAIKNVVRIIFKMSKHAGAGFFLFTIFDLFEGSYIILTSPLSEGQTDWRKA